MVKTVLVADHNSPSLISLAKYLADEPANCRILTARSPDAAIEFARQHQPDVAIVVASFVFALGKPLPTLLHAVSPKTEVIIVADPEPAKRES